MSTSRGLSPGTPRNPAGGNMAELRLESGISGSSERSFVFLSSPPHLRRFRVFIAPLWELGVNIHLHRSVARMIYYTARNLFCDISYRAKCPPPACIWIGLRFSHISESIRETFDFGTAPQKFQIFEKVGFVDVPPYFVFKISIYRSELRARQGNRKSLKNWDIERQISRFRCA